MKFTQEELYRIYQLAQNQGVEPLLTDVEKLEDGHLGLVFRAKIKDDPEVKNAETVNYIEQVKRGEKVQAQMDVPILPDSIFQAANEKQSHLERTVQETTYIFKLDKFEFPEEGGILCYLKGWDDDPNFGNGGKYNPLKYPRKGFPQPEPLSACNLAKRVLICQLKYFAAHPVSALPLLTKKGLNKWLDENGRIFGSILSPFYLADNRYMKCCRALREFLIIFLQEIGVKKPIAETIAQAIITMIEWDTAYSYRIRDLATVTNKELLSENPGREFKKIMDALMDRDPIRHELQGKFRAVFTMAVWAMYIPKYRRAFRKALEVIDFTMVQADEADWYHMLGMTGYKFGGVPDEERAREYFRLHDGRPPLGMYVSNASISK